MAGSKAAVQVVQVKVGAGSESAKRDYLAVEEPLEIRLVSGGETRQLAVTMRTPGADFELVAGFLYGEGVIRRREDIRTLSYCVDRDMDEEQRYNVVNAALAGDAPADLRSLERHFVMSSACGVCGKASIDAVMERNPEKPVFTGEIAAETIVSLPDRLREAQRVFETTGGLHAAALFTIHGQPLAVREDVGRHNAMDKLIGWALMQDKLPLSDCVGLVSGRASFELVQKAGAAGIPVLCAISAPSSLAVELARQQGMTLIGFLRGDQFNVYTGAERINLTPSPSPAERGERLN